MHKFLIKLIANGIIVIPLLMWFGGADFFEAAVSAVILCLVAYLVGDRLLLQFTGNTIAALADFILVYLFLWSASTIGVRNWHLSYGEMFVIAAAVAIVELWFHSYIMKRERRAYSR